VEGALLRRWAWLFWLTLGVAVLAVICAAAVHNGCFHPPPPVSRPDPGTPRGEYCATLEPARPWISLTVGPCALVLLAGVAGQPWRSPAVFVAGALCMAMVANAIVVNSLVSALTI
jgi:hypothetical protein